MNDFTLPAFEKLQRALAREFIDAFEKAGLSAVYVVASRVAPKVCIPLGSGPLPSKAEDQATDLLADAFLLLGKKRR